MPCSLSVFKVAPVNVYTMIPSLCQVFTNQRIVSNFLFMEEKVE